MLNDFHIIIDYLKIFSNFWRDVPPQEPSAASPCSVWLCWFLGLVFAVCTPPWICFHFRHACLAPITGRAHSVTQSVIICRFFLLKFFFFLLITFCQKKSKKNCLQWKLKSVFCFVFLKIISKSIHISCIGLSPCPISPSRLMPWGASDSICLTLRELQQWYFDLS